MLKCYTLLSVDNQYVSHTYAQFFFPITYMHVGKYDCSSIDKINKLTY